MPMLFPSNEDINSPESTGLINPLAQLEQNGYNVSSFVYPIDLTSDPGENHMIIFYINESKWTQFHAPNQHQQPVMVANQLGIVPPGWGVGAQINNQRDNNTNFNLIQTNRVPNVIAMYIPPMVQTSYKTDWSETAFGGVGGAVQGLMSGQGIGNDILRAAQSVGIGAISNALADLKDFTTDKIGEHSLDYEAAVSFAARAARNPHLEVVFKGIGFRQFQFEFKFTPRSEQEAICVNNIIKAFKFYSAPEVKHGPENERYYIYPAEFDIEFWSAGQINTWINKISTCACTNVTVQYTGAGMWSAFRPGKIIGAGVETNLSLTFQELEIITKERILQGY